MCRLLVTILEALATVLPPHRPAPAPAAPALVKDVAAQAPAVLAALVHVAEGRATGADALAFFNAVLAGVAFVDPAAAPVVSLVIDLEPIAAALIASGAVRPAAHPLAEGQTKPPDLTHGRWIGR